MAFFLETLLGGLMAGVLYSVVALGFVLIFKASGVFQLCSRSNGAVCRTGHGTVSLNGCQPG
jgi:branched-subunit amino acid ABC-type transport system permease component